MRSALCGSAVSTTRCHWRSPSLAGSVNGTLSVWPFKSTSTESPVIGSPRSFTSSIAVPESSMPSVRTNPACHAASSERRLRPAEVDQLAREVEQQLLVSVEVPVDPRQLVVLAVGVVVAALRPAELVAVADHRHALRQQHRRQEVALLPFPQRLDLRILGRSFNAAVPAQVVALA